MRGHINIALCVLALSEAPAQDSPLIIHGSIKEHLTDTRPSNLIVQARDLEDPANIVSADVSDRAKYVLVLNRISKYSISYQSPGFVARHITIDMHGPSATEWSNGFDIEIDLTLLRPVSDEHYDILDEPMARCAFDSSAREFRWDLEYSEALRKKILPLFEDYKRRSNMYMKKGR
jgi:hypothetical protein